MSLHATQELAKAHPNPVANLLKTWLRPRATDRDEAFRERVIRSTLVILILLALLSFAATIFVFRAQWALVSFPTLHVVALIGCFATAAAVSSGRLVTAGWFLSLTVLLGASGVILLAKQSGSAAGILNGVASFMFVPLVTTLVLPRNMIIPISLLSGFMYSLSQFAVQVGPADTLALRPDEQIVSVLLLLLIEGALLRQLRVEFDDRLEAMRESIRQTELARQQAEAERQRAEEADKAKSQFLANMSHELRTPLNAIIGYSEAMLGGMAGAFSPQQSKLLEHVQHNSRRLLALINDILDLSKIESGSLELYMAPMSPRKVIQDTVESLRSLALEKHIDLEITFADDIPEVILGDANKIQQILVNLVSNAIKFTEKGGVTVTVSAVEKGYWQFTVRDTGVGMPSGAANYIFDPFRQVDGSTTRKYKGTGLGLSISKRLVEKMDGSIEVVSQLGQGSTFTITLPRAFVPETNSEEEQVN